MLFSTAHGDIRLRKRLGVPKEDTTKASLGALHKGLPMEKATGELRRYLDTRMSNHNGNGRMFLWRNQIMVFALRTPVLLTCYPLPGRLQKSYVNQLERWRSKKE